MYSTATAARFSTPSTMGHARTAQHAASVLMGLGQKRAVPFFLVAVLVVAAHVACVAYAGMNPSVFAVIVGLIGLLCLSVRFNAAETPLIVSVTSPALKTRLALVERTNTDLEAALKTTQARLGQLMAERDTLAVQLTLDPLTGAQNRRGLDAAFATHGEGMVMALLDIDHFKRINDTLGHDVGDRVLRDFATRLRQSLNDSLPVYRVGGEEFIVLFPQARMAAVADMLARFRDDLQNVGVTRSGDGVAVSFSAGLARRDDATQSYADLFKLADERLYNAKVTGRAKTVYLDEASPMGVSLAA